MSVFKKIKKYLLILSLFFTITIGTHLIYVYLYDGAVKIPVIGGTVSVGFVGEVPTLNPLEFGKNSSNDYILQFLYKSLLRYDSVSRTMEGNLANCDLGKDFSKIKCFIKTGNTWSDGSPITKGDVLATYRTLKNTDINTIAKKDLQTVDINDKGEYIEFLSTNADLLVLDIFSFPIIKESQISKIIDGKITDKDIITSGQYLFGQKEIDTQYNTKKITILRDNDNSATGSYIGKYVFKFYADPNSLSKNEDSLNIISKDTNTKNIFVSPRFLAYKYILPQYIGLFMNTEKISNVDLRKFLLFQLENTNYGDILNKDTGKEIYNPFFTKDRITPTLGNKNIASIINSIGYYKKDILSSEVAKKFDEMLKPQKTNTGIASSSFFTTPTNKKISFTNNVGEILISGNVPTGTEAVYINDFKLTSFVPGNTKFYFRAKKDYNTLKQGINYYTLTTEIAGKKIKKETITVYAYEKPEELEAKKNEVINNIGKVKELTTLEKTKILGDKSNELSKIDALDSTYYYDKNLTKFKFKLEYLDNGQVFSLLAEKVRNEFKTLGIFLEIQPIDQKKIENMVNKGEKDYDMLLTGVNHGYYYYNITPFFHSGQAKEGFNFAKLKNTHLDLLLEKLKSSNLSDEKLQAIEKESFDVFRNEAVIKTFYDPYSTFYVDKNLKDVKQVEMLPNSYYTYDTIKNSYIMEKWIIDFPQKNISDFFKWLNKYI